MRFANPLKKQRTVTSTKGHSIDFPGVDKGKLTFVHVPPALHTEVMQSGMQAEDEIEEVDEVTGPVRPETEEGVTEALNAAFATIIERADREDFTGSGIPKVPSVTKLLGWKTSAIEVTAAWNAYQQVGG